MSFDVNSENNVEMPSHRVDVSSERVMLLRKCQQTEFRNQQVPEWTASQQLYTWLLLCDNQSGSACDTTSVRTIALAGVKAFMCLYNYGGLDMQCMSVVVAYIIL